MTSQAGARSFQVADDLSIRVSVIVPTYNRSGLLRKTLESLHRQNYPAEYMELWVIDDGSADDTAAVIETLRGRVPIGYVKQANGGATTARNNGAARATGEVLIFTDDDIELMPDAISNLARSLSHLNRSVVVGTLLATYQMESTGGSVTLPDTIAENDLIPISVGKCFTGLLAVKREDFLTLGMFQDPTGGWPNWDDVDFGYRAYLAGYELRRCRAAKAIHHDTAALSLTAASKRWFRAGHSAVRLFQRYPGLFRHLPMFHDKTPIRFGKDSVLLMGRKLARQFISSTPIQKMLQVFESRIIVRNIAPHLTEVVRRWILSGQVYNGLRQGIREYGDFQE